MALLELHTIGRETGGDTVTAYYQLRCATCDELFKPLVATKPGDLLHPDYDKTVHDGLNLESSIGLLRAFNDKHQGHALETVLAA